MYIIGTWGPAQRFHVLSAMATILYKCNIHYGLFYIRHMFIHATFAIASTRALVLLAFLQDMCGATSAAVL